MNDKLIPLLEEIRDQQKRQIENFERALVTQTEAMALHKKGRKVWMSLIIAPWALIGVLLLGHLAGLFA